MSNGFVVAKDGGALVRLRVSPGAKSTGLQGPYGDAAGRANAEVERFLAGLVGVAPSDVRITRGRSGRDKTAFVDGVGVERVREALAPRRR